MTTRRPLGKLATGAIALAVVAFVAGYLLAGARPAATDLSPRSAATAPAIRDAVESQPRLALGRAAAMPAIRVERPAPRPPVAPAPPPPPASATSVSPPPEAPAAPAPPPAPASPPAPAPSPAADPPATATPAPTFDSSGEPFDSSG